MGSLGQARALLWRKEGGSLVTVCGQLENGGGVSMYSKPLKLACSQAKVSVTMAGAAEGGLIGAAREILDSDLSCFVCLAGFSELRGILYNCVNNHICCKICVVVSFSSLKSFVFT